MNRITVFPLSSLTQVIQLHYTEWPDMGTPDTTDVMQELIAEVDIRKKGPEDPIVIHCSAGIGRTGTFLAIHLSIQKALKGEPIDIKQIVLDLVFLLRGFNSPPETSARRNGSIS